MSAKLVGEQRSFDESSRKRKNEKIAASYKATKEKRKRQTPRVIDLKIVSNKLSATQREALTRLFIEAKWVYNDALASDDVFAYKAPKASVGVHTPQGVEQCEFKVLGSQMKQSIVAGVRSSVKTLATLKKRGKKVGRLKFVSDYRSLDLKQAGTTYKVRGSKIRVQNIPGWLRVRGAHQLEGAELANAKILTRPDGYHLLVTCYRFTEELPDPVKHKGALGVDFGVKTSFTLSTGEKFDYAVGETERLKKLQRSLKRKTKGSNNYEKIQALITREYQHITNRRDDLANKFVHEILSCERVFIQDEQIAGWRSKKGYVRGGRKIQRSVLGRVKQKLVQHPRVTVLPKHVATTATCVCGEVTKHAPGLDVFSCPSCGYKEDRDIHAARNMIRLAGYEGKVIGVDCTDFKPVESVSSACDVVGAELGSSTPRTIYDREAGSPAALAAG